MNKIEKYYSEQIEDLKLRLKDNPIELLVKINQLSPQGEGIVRDSFLTDSKEYALAQISNKYIGAQNA